VHSGFRHRTKPPCLASGLAAQREQPLLPSFPAWSRLGRLCSLAMLHAAHNNRHRRTPRLLCFSDALFDPSRKLKTVKLFSYIQASQRIKPRTNLRPESLAIFLQSQTILISNSDSTSVRRYSPAIPLFPYFYSPLQFIFDANLQTPTISALTYFQLQKPHSIPSYGTLANIRQSLHDFTVLLFFL
jgi:hypothetical protein